MMILRRESQQKKNKKKKKKGRESSGDDAQPHGWGIEWRRRTNCLYLLVPPAEREPLRCSTYLRFSISMARVPESCTCRVSSAFYMHKNTTRILRTPFVACVDSVLVPSDLYEAYPDTTRPTLSVSYLPSTVHHGGINMQASVLGRVFCVPL